VRSHDRSIKRDTHASFGFAGQQAFVDYAWIADARGALRPSLTPERECRIDGSRTPRRNRGRDERGGGENTAGNRVAQRVDRIE
jgi:hypothetical protein